MNINYELSPDLPDLAPTNADFNQDFAPTCPINYDLILTVPT